MLTKPNPGQQVCVANTRPEKALKPKPCEELIGAEVETRFKPKRGGLILSKRKTVKRMMFDRIVEDIASAFCFRQYSSSSAASQADSDKSSSHIKMAPPLDSSNAKNNNKNVSPHP